MDCFSLLAAFGDEHEHGPLIRLARRLGPELFDVVLQEIGGDKMHVPTAAAFWARLRREVRDAEIRARFTGTNYGELASEYGLHPRRVRQIVHGRGE